MLEVESILVSCRVLFLAPTTPIEAYSAEKKTPTYPTRRTLLIASCLLMREDHHCVFQHGPIFPVELLLLTVRN